ncbi:MAG: porin [Litorimonas sp.]
MSEQIAAHSPLLERRLSPADPPNMLRRRLAVAIGPTVLLAMGATVVASAQSNSPFANRKTVNAWDLPQNTAPQGQTVPDVAPAPIPAPSGAPVIRATAPIPAPGMGLQLRTRPLDAETASAPPPQTRSAPSAAPIVSAPAVSAPRVTATVTTGSPSAPLSSPPLSSPPLTSPPLAPQGAPMPSVDVPSPGYVYNAPQQAPAWSGQDRSGVPRASVNAPPRAHASVDNPTDWTVHQLPRRSYGMSEDAWRSGGWEQAQSGNPTAQTYGYGPGGYDPQAQSRIPSQVPPQNLPQGQTYYDQSYPGAPQPDGSQGADYPGAPARRPGWLHRVGLGAVSTLIRGAIRAGVAARESNDWEEAFVGDADLEIELGMVTQTGLEWGVHGQVRAQYDEGRKGFTRRLPDCPPTTVGCASIAVPGSLLPASVRGHTSQFYTSGPDVATKEQIALESAHLFLRSAYGDVTVGRDDGAAFLFSLGAPTLLNVGASNSPVDYTGLDAVKTVNDASGFSEKITYTSPRLLGDQVGVGVQLGLSYAPDARGCGVDYCVDLNDIPNVVAPDIRDIVEAGIALDRTLARGVTAELTGTYARGSESSGLAGLDDLEAFGAGLELKVMDWTLGGSWLQSNQGLVNGDYESYDVGLTWQPSALGFTVNYGQAVDDLVGLKSDQIAGGVTWDMNERVRFGIGAQHADRKTIESVGGVAQLRKDKATALFIEGGITF